MMNACPLLMCQWFEQPEPPLQDNLPGPLLIAGSLAIPSQRANHKWKTPQQAAGVLVFPINHPSWNTLSLKSSDGLPPVTPRTSLKITFQQKCKTGEWTRRLPFSPKSCTGLQLYPTGLLTSRALRTPYKVAFGPGTFDLPFTLHYSLHSQVGCKLWIGEPPL